MDADARRRMAALERELQRLLEEVERLQEAQAPSTPHAAGPSHSDPPESLPESPHREPLLLLDARWLAAGGVLVLGLALLLFVRDAARWMAPEVQIGGAIAFVVALWGTGIYVGRGPLAHVLAGSGAVAAAAVAAGTAGVVGAQPAVLALAAVAVATLVDAGLRQVQSQAVIAAVLAAVAAGAGIAWPGFSIPFLVVMSLALLAASAWQRSGGVPVVVALGSGTVLVLHAFMGTAPGPVFGAAVLLWAAFVAMTWATRHEADIVVQSVVWLSTWGVGAWSMAAWGVPSGWWTAAFAVVALRLSFVAAPQRMGHLWRSIAVVAFVAFPLRLPWPEVVAAVWLVELALAVAFVVHRESVAAQVAAAGLTAALVARLVTYEATHLDATAVAVWVAASGVMAASWFLRRRSGGWLARTHLGLATAGILALVALVLDAPAVGFVWIAMAAVLVAEGMAMRSLDLRMAGVGAFGAAIVRLGFDLFVVHSVWRVLVFAGTGLVLLAAAWWWARLPRVEAT